MQQGNFGDFTVRAHHRHAGQFDVHIVPSADAPTGMGEPGLPPLAPAFANAVATLTGKTPRALPFEQSWPDQAGRNADHSCSAIVDHAHQVGGCLAGFVTEPRVQWR